MRFARPVASGTRTATGYGPLVPDPNPVPILALPEGFTYKLVARSGVTPTADGVHPSDPDGMGVFGGTDGGSVLVTNHENSGAEPFRVPAVPGVTYDSGAIGGTSTILVDRHREPDRRVHQPGGYQQQLCRRHHPLGHVADMRGDRTSKGRGVYLFDHGYVFEVDPSQPGGQRR